MMGKIAVRRDDDMYVARHIFYGRYIAFIDLTPEDAVKEAALHAKRMREVELN